MGADGGGGTAILEAGTGVLTRHHTSRRVVTLQRFPLTRVVEGQARQTSHDTVHVVCDRMLQWVSYPM